MREGHVELVVAAADADHVGELAVTVVVDDEVPCGFLLEQFDGAELNGRWVAFLPLRFPLEVDALPVDELDVVVCVQELRPVRLQQETLFDEDELVLEGDQKTVRRHESGEADRVGVHEDLTIIADRNDGRWLLGMETELVLERPGRAHDLESKRTRGACGRTAGVRSPAARSSGLDGSPCAPRSWPR